MPAPPLHAGTSSLCQADEADIVFTSPSLFDKPWITMSLPGQSEAGPTGLQVRIGLSAFRGMVPAVMSLKQSGAGPRMPTGKEKPSTMRSLESLRGGMGWCLRPFEGEGGFLDAYDFGGLEDSEAIQHGRANRLRAAAVLSGEPEFADFEPWSRGRAYLQMERHAGNGRIRGKEEILAWSRHSVEFKRAYADRAVRIARVGLITEGCSTQLELFRRKQDAQPRARIKLVAVVHFSHCPAE